MQAALKDLYSTDIADAETYLPDEEDNFGFVLRAMVGPLDGAGAESLDNRVLRLIPGTSCRFDAVHFQSKNSKAIAKLKNSSNHPITRRQPRASVCAPRFCAGSYGMSRFTFPVA